MTVTPAGRMLVTRRKFRLAMPASMSARSNAVNSVRPSPLPATIEMALGCSHMQESPPPVANSLGECAAAFLFHPRMTAPARDDCEHAGYYDNRPGGTLKLVSSAG